MNTTKLPDEQTKTTQDIVLRFCELAMQEKWFEIQDELFSEDVRSIEPEGSPYLGYAEGKSDVRKKGEAFVSRIREVHRLFTGEATVGGNYFAVGREMDLTLEGSGRIQISQIMMYEVKNGKIISEQFFYEF